MIDFSSFEVHCTIKIIRDGGKGGGWVGLINPIRPGWPNSQLPFRNLLTYVAQTLRLSVFIPKTCSDQILAKLVSRGKGGCCCSFLIKDVSKILKMKKFSFARKLLKLASGVNFGSKRSILEIKTHFFLKS